MALKTHTFWFLKCRYHLIKFFRLFIARPRWTLRLSFRCPKKDSSALVLLGICLSSRKWNILGMALINRRLTRRSILCLYQVSPVLGLILNSRIKSWCSRSQSYKALSQTCLSYSDSIKWIFWVIDNNCLPAILFGSWVSQIRDILWICTRQRWTGTLFLKTFLMAFKMALWPSHVILSTWIFSALRFSRSSRISL